MTRSLPSYLIGGWMTQRGLAVLATILLMVSPALAQRPPRGETTRSTVERSRSAKKAPAPQTARERRDDDDDDDRRRDRRHRQADRRQHRQADRRQHRQEHRPHRRDDRRHRRDNRRHQHDRRHASRTRPHGHRPPVVVRPQVHINFDWPWEYRHRRGWSTRYRYRQVVYVDAGWGRRHREVALDIRTTYRHRIRSANRRRAQVELDIERIEIFRNGRFLGEVNRIPNRLGRIRATLHRNGAVDFERTVFLLGDPRSGFELISTRAYDGYLLNAYHSSHRYRAGFLDFNRGRVVQVDYSEFFDPYEFDGYVPIDLLPVERDWLWDYGHESISYAKGYGYDGHDSYRRDAPLLRAPRGETSGRPGTPAFSQSGSATRLQRQQTLSYETRNGARIQLRREAEIERIDP